MGAVVLAVGITMMVSARQLPPAFSVSATSTIHPVGPSTPEGLETGSGAPSPRISAVAAAPFRPTALTLGAFAVTAPVDPVLSAEGVLAPPEDPARVGWWAASALAGSAAGSTVVVGHVDGPDGPGALYRLVHVQAGDRLVVTGAGGGRATYVVTALQFHGKGQPLPTSLFGVGGPARLVVISCGGPFDRSDDQYEDNVVVEATPV